MRDVIERVRERQRAQNVIERVRQGFQVFILFHVYAYKSKRCRLGKKK